jgi:hypothetical protein
MRILPILLLLPTVSIAGDTVGHELGWLEGCWVTPDRSAQEVWVVDADGALAGFAVAISDNKVDFYEVLSIKGTDDGSLIYTAHPIGQAPASFEATDIKANSVLFVNADHDYPQEIRYARESNHLYARISLLDGRNPSLFDKVACESLSE